MKIILTTLDGNVYPVEVGSDFEIINLKALCEQETGIAAARMSLSFNGRLLNDTSKTLADYSIGDNDIIVVQTAPSNASIDVPLIDFGSINVPRSRPHSSRTSEQALTPNLANMLQMLMSDPSKLEAIRQRFPDLANAIQQKDSGKCRILFPKN
ncbi:DDI1 -like protein [Brachionus plicatilis]|uniref:DDI1-like protein n=1 Tax=Brachionus plicatilis TaxID=10195 RepID=A0A3M7RRY7_BRAPC|nr:DDI1 -like protein [Brachionus plicatilis]